VTPTSPSCYRSNTMTRSISAAKTAIRPEKQLQHELDSLVYRNPEGDWQADCR